MIECELQLQKEYGTVVNVPGESRERSGRYHGSMFWDIPGFGKKKWVVATRIKVIADTAASWTDKEIIEGCIEYINTPPPRRKFQRRIRNTKYGQLDLYKARLVRSHDGMHIAALLITDKRKSKHFWGKGFVS